MWGAIASAVAGAVASGAMNWASSKDTASANNAFSADMANTQYQRAVSDMRKAGLNPMLAGLRASGNASPIGSQTDPRPGDSFSSGIQTAVNSALGYASLENNINQTNSNVQLNRAQEDFLKQQTVSELAKQQQIQANTALALEQAKQTEQATKSIELSNYKWGVLNYPFKIVDQVLTPELDKVVNSAVDRYNDKPKKQTFWDVIKSRFGLGW